MEERKTLIQFYKEEGKSISVLQIQSSWSSQKILLNTECNANRKKPQTLVLFNIYNRILLLKSSV